MPAHADADVAAARNNAKMLMWIKRMSRLLA
jgi:hypothetical protein